ncbi:hypothetical protein CC79DRAFT_1371127 [Sarocladium strictum]
MGSSQPPNDELLFGYAFNEPPPEPLPEAPEPAPGNPLLSETDNRLLSSFFEDMTTDQYNMPSFGEGLNFSNAWFDLPPQFMGSATSIGQQPDLAGVSPTALTTPPEQPTLQRQAMLSSMMPPPPPPPASHGTNQSPQQQQTQYQQQHSEDVLHAAATLLQNGAAARGEPAMDFGLSRRAMGPPVGHLRHQPMEEFKEETRRAHMTEYPDDNTFMDWMGTAALQPQRSHSRLMPVGDYQWGSDSNFTASKAYTPGSHKDTVESQHQQQLDVLGCLEPSQSANSTRPNSPRAANSKPVPSTSGSQALKLPEDPEAPPRKRRKSKIVKTESNADDDDEADETSSSKASRRRKPKSEPSQASSPPGSVEGSKRRKSAVNGSKASRENLTEEQKRENHIKSEQKRRTLIKEGFDDLCILIPGLQSRGLSKSTMLTMAAEYLEQLIEGNKELTDQLASLEGK